jgi:hypothetical protein
LTHPFPRRPQRREDALGNFLDLLEHTIFP